jgi:hypothetical protein
VATLLLTTQTLTTPTANQHALASPSLRTWLGNDWAILFSHPNDFVSYDLEVDRWLVITRRAFSDRHVRPIALGVATGDGEIRPDHSWVSQVSGDERTILLEDPKQQHFGPVDLQAPVLREEIERSERRFVMIVDNALRVQKKLSYASLSDLPSPLELLGWANALRAKQVARQTTAPETARRSTPPTQVHPFFATHRPRHRVPKTACAPQPHARAV